MIDRQLIQDLVTEYISEQYPTHYIVDIMVHPANRIVVELGNDNGVSIDECIRLTKYIESRVDREVEDYELEVGSAGLTASFKVLRQYEGAVGEEVEVLRKGGIKEKGVLAGATAESIALTVARRIKPDGAKRKMDVEETITIPMNEILQCKRIIKI